MAETALRTPAPPIPAAPLIASHVSANRKCSGIVTAAASLLRGERTALCFHGRGCSSLRAALPQSPSSSLPRLCPSASPSL